MMMKNLKATNVKWSSALIYAMEPVALIINFHTSQNVNIVKKGKQYISAEKSFDFTDALKESQFLLEVHGLNIENN
jgi:hypothetical protein